MRAHSAAKAAMMGLPFLARLTPCPPVRVQGTEESRFLHFGRNDRVKGLQGRQG